MAESRGIRGKYRKPRRDLAQQEIRRLVVEQGMSNKQISFELKIPLKTIERYIKDLYVRDNDLLAGLNGTDELLTQRNICKDRFESHRQEILANIARNPSATFTEQLKAWNLICELEAAELRLREETPAMVTRRLPIEVIRGRGGPLPYSNRQFYGDQEKKKEEERRA